MSTACTSSSTTTTLTTLPLEILHNITSQLPLYLHPSTVAALSLLCHDAFVQFSPLLCTHLIFKDESSALDVLQNLLQSASSSTSRAASVRSIHIRCADTLYDYQRPHERSNRPSSSTGRRPPPRPVARRLQKGAPSIADVVKALHALIKTGALARLSTIEMHLHGFWMAHNRVDTVSGFGELVNGLCTDLQTNCKALKGLHITGARDTLGWDADPEAWFTSSSIHGLMNLEVLELRFQRDSISLAGESKLFTFVQAQSSSLRSLTLQQDLHYNLYRDSTSEIFDFTFPQLQVLCLGGGHITYDASRRVTMSFFERHSSLETLVLPEFPARSGLMFTWLTNDDAATFLPRLKHLSASWRDTRALAVLIPRLTSLTIFSPYLDQIPHLFSDTIIPAHSRPLTNLKSLSLLDISIGYRPAFLDIDGRYWSREGTTVEVSYRRSPATARPFRPSEAMVQAMASAEERYIAAIVTACPNLEELALQRCSGWAPSHQQFADVAESLGALRVLNRIFFDGKAGTLAQMKPTDRKALIQRATALATSCRALEEVGLVPTDPLNRYITAYISRAVTDEVANPDSLTNRGANGESTVTRRVTRSATRSRSVSMMDDSAASAVDVDAVTLGNGFGMTIGKDLDAFPTVSFPLQFS